MQAVSSTSAPSHTPSPYAHAPQSAALAAPMTTSYNSSEDDVNGGSVRDTVQRWGRPGAGEPAHNVLSRWPPVTEVPQSNTASIGGKLGRQGETLNNSSSAAAASTPSDAPAASGVRAPSPARWSRNAQSDQASSAPTNTVLATATASVSSAVKPPSPAPTQRWVRPTENPSSATFTPAGTAPPTASTNGVSSVVRRWSRGGDTTAAPPPPPASAPAPAPSASFSARAPSPVLQRWGHTEEATPAAGQPVPASSSAVALAARAPSPAAQRWGRPLADNAPAPSVTQAALPTQPSSTSRWSRNAEAPLAPVPSPAEPVTNESSAPRWNRSKPSAGPVRKLLSYLMCGTNLITFVNPFCSLI